MDVDTQRTLGLVLFTVYATLLAVGLVSTLLRYRVFRSGIVPRLWYRDVVLLGGHAITILLIMLARGLGLDFATNPLWWVITSIPPLIAIGTYVYFELFIIGRT